MAPRSPLAAVVLVALATASGCCGTGAAPQETPSEAVETAPEEGTPPPVDQESDQYPSD